VCGRREFLRQGWGGLCFVIPLFREGKQGQPVLAPGPWFADAARRAGLGAFRDTCGAPAKSYLVETVGSGVALFDYNADGGGGDLEHLLCLGSLRQGGEGRSLGGSVRRL